MHDSAQILAIKLAVWQKEIESVRNFYQVEHANWVEVNGGKSKWWVWNRGVDVAQQSIRQIQQYLQRIADGKHVFFKNVLNF